MPSGIVEILLVLFTAALVWLYLGRVSWVKNSCLSVRDIQLMFLIKVFVGIGLAVFYAVYYNDRANSDAFRFFDDAKLISALIWDDPATYFRILLGVDMDNPKVVETINQTNNWYKAHLHGVFNDNQTIIRFNALLLPISQGYFHIHTVIMALLSLSGLVALCNALTKWFKGDRLLYWAVVLFPQVLFWSSGVLKEGLMFFSLGWFIYYLTELYRGNWNKKIYVGFVLSLFAMVLIKSYVLLCLIPAIVFLFVVKVIPKANTLVYWLGIMLTLGIAVVGLDSLNNSRRAHSIYQKQHDFINEAQERNAGSYFESFVLEPHWNSILLNAPEAFWNSISRPRFSFSSKLVSKMAALENWLLYALTAFSLLFFRKPDYEERLFALFALSFTIMLLLLIGLTTPVEGAIIRYKIPVIPFYLAMLYIFTDKARLLTFLRKVKR